ncbi:dATP pyrophosphohydrolase [Granulibacter bethesdensis]|nr:dATP pyrophosphohydrolase [Granulibacter bethesdensis]
MISPFIHPASGIEIIPMRSKADRERFIAFPDRLAAEDPYYIAPLRIDQRMLLSQSRNPYFRHAKAAFWLARRHGRDVGRISAQHDLLEPNGIGHFGMLAAEDDAAVFAALLRTVEAWHRERGIGEIQGPFNLSINETAGVLVDGFETPPMLMMGHDQPYVGSRLEEQGYEKARDLLAYLYDTEAPLPPFVGRMLNRPLPQGLSIRHLNWSRYREEVASITAIFNDAWSDNWGFVPLTEDETDAMAQQLKLLLHDKMIWFADYEGKPIAFIVALPNLNEAIRDLRGKLWPFGLVRLLWRLKIRGVKTARVPLMGIKRSFSHGLLGSLIPFLLVDAVRRESAKLGMCSVELSWVLENNDPMRRMNEALGGSIYKTYRVYRKSLMEE